MSDLFVRDNQIRAKVSFLKTWDKNPRSIKEDNFEQLVQDLKKEQFKPLLILDDGTVLGGNMRLRAYQKLGVEDLWVSVITLQENEGLWVAFINGKQDETFQSRDDALLHYSTIDNSPYGYNDKEKIAELFSLSTLPVDNYFVSLDEATPVEAILEELGPSEEEEQEKEKKKHTCPSCGFEF